jgi:MFS superfamily sulfate permease-like transporter/CRP-like cAMP-binding protein
VVYSIIFFINISYYIFIFILFKSCFILAIAGDIVFNSKDVESIVPTTLFIIAICTAMLGFMLIIIARLKLGQIIQYLPMPVIGGYLAFIGFFCGEAGLAMMSGVEVSNIVQWNKFASWEKIILLTPGVVIGITIYVLLRNIRSPMVLPTCLATTLVLFYSILFISGHSIEDAREMGWIYELSPSEPFYMSWKLYDLSLVDWSALPRQFVRWFAMLLVVAFSSSLDVAAIEMELGIPLDYNKELETVGISNLSSGLMGGFTGSYIFSQTIFTMKRGIRSRLCGYIIAFIEILVILLPFSITSYIPKMFFGCLLILISIDLMYEWLVEAKHKMMSLEYSVCLSTFIVIQLTGIEVGMALGIIFSMSAFIYTYAALPRISSTSLKASTVVRTFEERSILLSNRGKIVTISLNGYIFFGSAVKILEQVKSNVVIMSTDDPVLEKFQKKHKVQENTKTTSWKAQPSPSTPRNKLKFKTSFLKSPSANRLNSCDEDIESKSNYDHFQPSVFFPSPKKSPDLMYNNISNSSIDIKKKSGYFTDEDISFDNHKSLFEEILNNKSNRSSIPIISNNVDISPTEYLVLDFTSVLGVDATAARSCFLMLSQLMRSSDVKLVFAQISSKIEALLRCHDVIKSDDIVIPLVDDALEWCEEQVLYKVYMRQNSPYSSSKKLDSPGLNRDPSYYAKAWEHRHNHALILYSGPPKVESNNISNSPPKLESIYSLQRILQDYLEIGTNCSSTISRLLEPSLLVQFFTHYTAKSGEILFDEKSPDDSVSIYFIEEGVVEIIAVNDNNNSNSIELVQRIMKISSGGIFGQESFFLGSFSNPIKGLCITTCKLWKFSRENFSKMEEDEPKLCILFQHLLLKSLSISSISRMKTQL